MRSLLGGVVCVGCSADGGAGGLLFSGFLVLVCVLIFWLRDGWHVGIASLLWVVCFGTLSFGRFVAIFVLLTVWFVDLLDVGWLVGLLCGCCLIVF